MKIRCIVLEDEPIALKQMAGYVEKTPFLILEGQFRDALSAIDFLQENEIDLMFVDINMPDLSGLEFVKSLEKDAPRVIFATAYSNYALEGFKVDALDYLLKPVDYAQFMKAANKAKKWFELAGKHVEEVKANRDFLMIKSGHSILRITIAEIKYIEGMREYVRIYLANQKPVMTLVSMKKLEAILPASKFMRVHRSFIVNLDRITLVERFRIIFDGDIRIPVSDQYKAKFQDYIDKNFLV